MQHKAVFVDRDGVINRERTDYTKIPDEFELLPDVSECLNVLKRAGFKIIVITNQSMINRGLSSEADLSGIHDKMTRRLAEDEFSFDGIYYCPHRPDEKCKCRKPEAGLIVQAVKDHNIDVHESWFIGDKDSDISAGMKAGCKTIKIETNSSLWPAVKQIMNA